MYQKTSEKEKSVNMLYFLNYYTRMNVFPIDLRMCKAKNVRQKINIHVIGVYVEGRKRKQNS